MKMKRRRIDLTKNVREHCKFCEFSSSRYGCSSEERLQEQDNESVMRKEVERLRFLIRRMTGKDDGVSYTELVALESHLFSDVKHIVIDQMKKIKLEEDERLHTRKKEAKDEDNGAPPLEAEREFERRNAESF